MCSVKEVCRNSLLHQKRSLQQRRKRIYGDARKHPNAPDRTARKQRPDPAETAPKTAPTDKTLFLFVVVFRRALGVETGYRIEKPPAKALGSRQLVRLSVISAENEVPNRGNGNLFISKE